MVICQDVLIFQVKIRHIFPEDTIKVAIACLMPAWVAIPVTPARIVGLPDVPIAFSCLAMVRVNEQGVSNGTMVDHIIHDHTNTSFVRRLNKGIKISQGSIVLFNGSVICNRVAVIVIITGIDWHQPDPFNTELL